MRKPRGGAKSKEEIATESVKLDGGKERLHPTPGPAERATGPAGRGRRETKQTTRNQGRGKREVSRTRMEPAPVRRGKHLVLIAGPA